MPPLSNRDRISNPLKDPQVMSWWRTFPAHAFGSKSRLKLAESLDRYSATNSVLQRALRGDAASAVRIALQLRRDETIAAHTDLAMTALLRCALDGSGGAALVLSHALGLLPLENPNGARRLGVSWLAHNLASVLPQKSHHKGSKKFPSQNGGPAGNGRVVPAADRADVGGLS